MTKKEDYRLERYITIARVSGKSLLRALAVPILVIAAIGLANADDDNDDAYAIGLWGDLPYSAEQAAGVSALIADMNWRRLAFTVHDGDLKAGGTRCDDVIYTNALGYFNSLKAPAAFTPATMTGPTATAPPLERSHRASALISNVAFSSARRSRWVSADCARKCRRRRFASA